MVETLEPLIPQIPDDRYTELQHRLDGRISGILAPHSLSPSYDLPRHELFDRFESTVGNTPLLHIEDVAGSSILAKVESQNPTENHYDRVFERTIRQLERDDVITPGDELIRSYLR